MGINKNGLVLWEGPSEIDGKPIVVIVTGLEKSSDNVKTGDLLQTWILRSDIAPNAAVKSGQDVSICGDCVHRGDGKGKDRTCYVTVFRAPLSIWKAYKRGSYRKAERHEIAGLGAGRGVRFGSYGDPAAAPGWLWQEASEQADFWTGYSHQSLSLGSRLARLCMASADSVAEKNEANAIGFRTFRVMAKWDGVTDPASFLEPDEIGCPASEEFGKKTTCDTCRLCMGTAKEGRPNIAIFAHGNGAAKVVESFAV